MDIEPAIPCSLSSSHALPPLPGALAHSRISDRPPPTRTPLPPPPLTHSPTHITEKECVSPCGRSRAHSAQRDVLSRFFPYTMTPPPPGDAHTHTHTHTNTHSIMHSRPSLPHSLTLACVSSLHPTENERAFFMCTEWSAQWTTGCGGGTTVRLRSPILNHEKCDLCNSHSDSLPTMHSYRTLAWGTHSHSHISPRPPLQPFSPTHITENECVFSMWTEWSAQCTTGCGAGTTVRLRGPILNYEKCDLRQGVETRACKEQPCLPPPNRTGVCLCVCVCMCVWVGVWVCVRLCHNACPPAHVLLRHLR